MTMSEGERACAEGASEEDVGEEENSETPLQSDSSGEYLDAPDHFETESNQSISFPRASSERFEPLQPSSVEKADVVETSNPTSCAPVDPGSSSPVDSVSQEMTALPEAGTCSQPGTGKNKTTLALRCVFPQTFWLRIVSAFLFRKTRTKW